MNPLLANWYSDVSVGISGEALAARGAAIDALLPRLDRAKVLSLVALAHERPPVESDGWFRQFFQDHDPAFLVRGNDREVAVLAGACLVDLCGRDDDLAVLAASAAAVAARRDWRSLVEDVPSVAEQRLLDLGAARRQPEHRPAAAWQSVWTKGVMAAVAKEFQEAAPTAESIVAAIGRLAGAVNGALERAAAETNEVAAWAERSIEFYKEESQLLAWLLAGHSTTLDVPWASLDPAAAAVIAARELTSLLVVIPAPPQADALIDQLLAATPFPKRAPTTDVPPLDVPASLEFLVQQEPGDSGPTELARLSLRQAVLLEAWAELE